MKICFKIGAEQGRPQHLRPKATGGLSTAQPPSSPKALARRKRRETRRFSRSACSTSTRFWSKSRSCRKQTIKPFLPGATTRFRRCEFFLHSVTQRKAFDQVVIPLLTESDTQTEFTAIYRKQTTEKFLTEARTHIKDFTFSHNSVTQTASKFANPRSRRRPLCRQTTRQQTIRKRRFTPPTPFLYPAGPMLDLGYVREHLDTIEKMARDRRITLDLAGFRNIDSKRRQLITVVEALKATRNRASHDIGILMGGAEAMGNGPDAQVARSQATEKIREMKETSERIKTHDTQIAELDEKLRHFLLTIPNIPHSSVPVGKSAADNVEVRRWGAPPKFDFKPRPHWEIGEAAGILDFQSAVKIAGSRFAVYKGLGARLERALANFFLDLHTREHGYTEILPPFLVNTA